MVQTVGEGRHLKPGRRGWHAAFGPALGRCYIDGRQQGLVGSGQLRLGAGAGGDGQRRFFAAAGQSDRGCGKEKRSRR